MPFSKVRLGVLRKGHTGNRKVTGEGIHLLDISAAVAFRVALIGASSQQGGLKRRAHGSRLVDIAKPTDPQPRALLVSVRRRQALRSSVARRFRRRARMEMKAIATNAMR